MVRWSALKALLLILIMVPGSTNIYATVIWESVFENGILKYAKDNNHPGGGVCTFLGGELGTYYTPGDGCSYYGDSQNVNIDGSADAQGGPSESQIMALKTHYRKECGKSFQKNTTIIKFPEIQTVYVRWYQKWSKQWVWPSIQQKFIKIANRNKTSSQNFYFQSSAKMKVNYVELGKQTPTFTPLKDDYLKNDTSIVMETGKWYEIQIRVTMSSPGSSNGILEYWIDGTQIFGLYNIENNNGSTDYLNHIELQHVYDGGENGNDGYPPVDMPTWMKNIAISTEYIPSLFDNTDIRVAASRSSGFVDFDVTVKRPGSFSLTVCDMSGTIIWAYRGSASLTGTKCVRWTPQDTKAAAGMYCAILKQMGNRIFTKKIVVIR